MNDIINVCLGAYVNKLCLMETCYTLIDHTSGYQTRRDTTFATIMDSGLFALFFLLVHTETIDGQRELYIAPSLNGSCPRESCLTLSQFAASPSSYTGNETDLRLIFLQGNHTLARELSLQGAGNFSMESQDNETVEIECASQSARFAVSDTTRVSIKGIVFYGCGNNTITTVEELTVEDAVFQGVKEEGRGTALVLTRVNFANIVTSLFCFNTLGDRSERHDATESQSGDLESVGRALLMTSSNVLIIKTDFYLNTADQGGVLLARKTNITITQCTFSHNKAYFGGVMYTDRSTVIVNNSTFTNNAAEKVNCQLFIIILDYCKGGVMDTFGGSFTITRSTFTNNTAYHSGGVVAIWNGLLNITSSIFTNNTVTAGRGGVLMLYSGSFTITSSTFIKNSAAQDGGVIIILQGSFTVMSSTFTNNSASRYGGAMYTSDGALTIVNSTFIYNKADKFGGIIHSNDGSVNIDNSGFNNNTAEGHFAMLYKCYQ